MIQKALFYSTLITIGLYAGYVIGWNSGIDQGWANYRETLAASLPDDTIQTCRTLLNKK